MEPANSDGEGKGGSNNCPSKSVLETYLKPAPWGMDLSLADEMESEELPSDVHEIPTLSLEYQSFDQDAECKENYKTNRTRKEPQTNSKRAELVARYLSLRERIPMSKSDIKTTSRSPNATTVMDPLPVNSGLEGKISSKAAYTKPLIKQTSKPAASIARQKTFLLDKPSLSVHIPKFLSTAGSTANEQAGTDVKSNTPATKIPLPKSEKLTKPSRIPLPKRTLAGKNFYSHI